MEEILRQFLSSSNHSLKDSPFPMIPLSFDTSIMSPTECQQPKPQHSYIGLIAMAILSSPQKKMVLAEVKYSLEIGKNVVAQEKFHVFVAELIRRFTSQENCRNHKFYSVNMWNSQISSN